jgi:AraC-like DNA-binding protein
MPWTRVLKIKDPLLSRNAIVGCDFETLPTKRGNFQADITQIEFNRLRMLRYHLNLPQISTISLRPGRMVIGFLTEAHSSAQHYRGTRLEFGDIVINRSTEVHQRVEDNLHGGAMSLSVGELGAMLESVVGRNFLEKMNKPVIRPSPALMSRLLKLHDAVGQLAHDTPEILKLPEACRALEEQLTHLMVRCLAEGVGVEITAGCRRHDAVITRFEDFLAAHPDRPLHLTEICAAIGVAERTLRAACEEHLGMGPIRFLTLRRMYLVRSALLGSDAIKTSVTRVVTDHGFWELGRFSVAYRALFGESPSETLRRPADQPRISLNRPLALSTDLMSGLPN